MRDGGSSLFNKTNIPINQNLKYTKTAGRYDLPFFVCIKVDIDDHNVDNVSNLSRVLFHN